MKYAASARAMIAAGVAALVMISQPASAAIVAEVEPNDTMATAQNLDSNFTTDFDANNTNSTTMPQSSVRAGSSDIASLDWYSFTVGAAGVEGIFDIDFGMPNLDSWINLYNSSGTLLTSNDDGGIIDPGTVHPFDYYLTYTFGAAGTYYLRVGAFPDQPTNQSYILNVSLGNSVPEASTWAMMLLGFAGMGVALRRRRSLQTRTVGA